MKKALCLILGSLIVLFSHPAYAKNSYIHITPLPYSSYILGEDITVRGETDFDFVTLGFYYPEEDGYYGLAKFIISLSASELRGGYVIPTDTLSKQWPEGSWRILVQSGSVRDDIYVTLLEKPVYDKYLRIAEYDGGILTKVSTYPTRGAVFSENVISFALDGGITLRLFFWNDALSPENSGNGSIYAAFCKDGTLLSATKYSAELSQSFPVTMTKDGKTVKLLYWNNASHL